MKNLKFFFVASFMLAFLGVEAQTTWSTTGNAGTNAATNFIGTTDSKPLVFKINNTFSGTISQNNVTSFGLNSCQGGAHVVNTAFGENAIRYTLPNSGGGNTAVGFSSLMNCTNGFNNVAIGHNTMLNNIYGQANTAIGANALFKNIGSSTNESPGSFNTAVGFNALYNNNAENNVGVGNSTLSNNINGIFNVALGSGSLSKSTGDYNVSVGGTSGSSLLTGVFNTFLGNASGLNMTSGDRNLFLGNYAGYNITSGNSNTIIGVMDNLPTTMSSTTLIGTYNTGIQLTMDGSNSGFGRKFRRDIPYTAPSNTLEIDSDSSGQSGLTFSKLTTANTPAVTTFDGVLSVDATGKVILVKDKVGTGSIVGITNSCTTKYNVPTTASNTNGNLGCGRIYDNGATVSIGTALTNGNPVSYTTTGSVNGFNVPSSGNILLDVNGIIRTVSIFATSDRKFKKGINPIDNALNIVQNLEGKTYNWDKEGNPKMNFDANLHSGFIAQEIEKVLPHLVATTENGEKAVNYIELMPYLVEAIKAQQNQIVALNNHIEDLLSKGILEENKITDGKTYFSSNYPNPFETSTKIDYFIHTSVKEAQIIVYDFNGTTISKYELKERGTTANTVINKGNLKAGTYFYTLITDGAVIGTKKMIVK